VLALVTLAVKAFIEWRYRDELAATAQAATEQRPPKTQKPFGGRPKGFCVSQQSGRLTLV
jgi:hypothetical protein